MGDLPEIILREFLRLAKGVEHGELERAKVQLKSHLMMNLEQRPVVFEDLSRQIMSHGIRRKPQYFVNAIGMFAFVYFLQHIQCQKNFKILPFGI